MFSSSVMSTLLAIALGMEGIDEPCGAIWQTLCPDVLPSNELHLIHRRVSVKVAAERSTGKYYFEVRLERGCRYPLIGWATDDFVENKERPCKGVGKDAGGWSISVGEQLKYDNGVAKRVRVGSQNRAHKFRGVVGCAIDLEVGRIWFSFNGEWIPHAAISIKKHIGKKNTFFPVVTSPGQFRVHLKDFEFAAPSKEYKSLFEDSEEKALGDLHVCHWPPNIVEAPCKIARSLDDTPEELRNDLQVVSAILPEVAPNHCRPVGSWDCSAAGVLEAAWDGWTTHDHRTILGCGGGDAPRLIRLYFFDLGLKGTLPSEIGKLDAVQGLYFADSDLHGQLPSEVGDLHLLEDLASYDADLQGSLPSELGRLTKLEYLEFSRNSLEGLVPTELGDAQYLEVWRLSRNSLVGQIASEWGRLSTLRIWDFGWNSLFGQVPFQLASLPSIKSIELDTNLLKGSLPAEFGELKKLELLRLGNNSLEGVLPPELGKMNELRRFEIEDNLFSGPIPEYFGNMNRLRVLHLQKNSFLGTLPPEIGNNRQLRFFSVSKCSKLYGEIPTEFGKLDLVHFWAGKIDMDINYGGLNDFSGFEGSIPSSFGNFKRLQSLDLSYNDFMGTLPSSLFRFYHIDSLMLSVNCIGGSIPSVIGKMTLLKYLMIHSNYFEGSLPTELGQLKDDFTVFTAHDNEIQGRVHPLFLSPQHKSGQMVLTLHGNLLSCTLPPVVKPELPNELVSELKSLVVQGNMFDGPMPKWVDKTDLQSDLLYNPYPGLDIVRWNVELGLGLLAFVITLWIRFASVRAPVKTITTEDVAVGANTLKLENVSGVLAGMLLTISGGGNSETKTIASVNRDSSWLLSFQRRVVSGTITLDGKKVDGQLQYAYTQGAAIAAKAFVVTIYPVPMAIVSSVYKNLLKASVVLFPAALALMMLYINFANYFECGRHMPRASAAYYQSQWIVNWCIVFVWCVWLGMASVLAIHGSVIRDREFSGVAKRDVSRQNPIHVFVVRPVGWILSVLALCTFSWPTIIFVIVVALPDDNTFYLGPLTRRILWALTPVLQSLNDSLAGPFVAKRIGTCFGIPRTNLMTLLRMLTGWIVFLVVSILYQQGCGSRWKSFWIACASQHPSALDFVFPFENIFDAELPPWEVTLIDTESDICDTAKDTWYTGSHCDRKVIESLEVFVSIKLFLAAFLKSGYYAYKPDVWMENPQEMMGKQAMVVSLALQVGIIWVPFAPLLLPLVIFVIIAHFIVFRLCCPPGVDDELLYEARFMLEFLKPNVGICAIFMVRFASVTEMHGRYVLYVCACLTIVGLICDAFESLRCSRVRSMCVESKFRKAADPSTRGVEMTSLVSLDLNSQDKSGPPAFTSFACDSFH